MPMAMLEMHDVTADVTIEKAPPPKRGVRRVQKLYVYGIKPYHTELSEAQSVL